MRYSNCHRTRKTPRRGSSRYTYAYILLLLLLSTYCARVRDLQVILYIYMYYIISCLIYTRPKETDAVHVMMVGDCHHAMSGRILHIDTLAARTTRLRPGNEHEQII